MWVDYRAQKSYVAEADPPPLSIPLNLTPAKEEAGMTQPGKDVTPGPRLEQTPFTSRPHPTIERPSELVARVFINLEEQNIVRDTGTITNSGEKAN